MRKTIKQLNAEAAGWIAFHFLRASEQILAENRSPAPLSIWERKYALQWIPEHVWTEGKNPRWWVSEKNWPIIHRLAIREAKQVLRVLGAEKYPRTLAYFTLKSGDTSF